jgi:hypothetical protein
MTPMAADGDHAPAFAMLWPSERACGKIVARDDGCLDE